MIKINFYISLFFTLFLNNLIYSQKIEDINFNYNKSTKKVDIDYKISDLKSNLYNVNFKPFYSSGKSISVNSFNADLTNIKRGLHSIVWDPKNDGIQIDGDVYLTMYLNTKINVSVQKHLLKSIVYPGFGDYQLRNKKHYFLYGLAAYGLLGSSIYFNNQASANYNSYLLNMNFNESQGLYNDYQTNNRMSKIFAFSSAFIWTVDLVSILKRGNKVKEDLTVSDYYNKLSKIEEAFNSKIKYFNTKEDYYIAYENAVNYYKAGDYKKAKEYLNRIDNLNPSKEIILKKKKLMIDVNYELKLIDNKYKLLINEGDEFVRTKKYEEAIEKYEEAKRIRSTSYLRAKIEKSQKAIQNEICDDIVKVANNLKASKKWKEALEKYTKANSLCPSQNIVTQIKIAEQKLKNQKLGEKIVNKKWYEIYNQNGLKVELLFEIKKGLCTNPYAVIYFEYRYTGKVSNTYTNKYLNWSVEYERCDNSKWKFNHAVQVSGDLFKQPTNQNPNYQGSNFITPKKFKVMNESIKAGNDNIYFDVKSIKELSSKYITDMRK